MHPFRANVGGFMWLQTHGDMPCWGCSPEVDTIHGCSFISLMRMKGREQTYRAMGLWGYGRYL